MKYWKFIENFINDNIDNDNGIDNNSENNQKDETENNFSNSDLNGKNSESSNSNEENLEDNEQNIENNPSNGNQSDNEISSSENKSNNNQEQNQNSKNNTSSQDDNSKTNENSSNNNQSNNEISSSENESSNNQEQNQGNQNNNSKTDEKSSNNNQSSNKDDLNSNEQNIEKDSSKSNKLNNEMSSNEDKSSNNQEQNQSNEKSLNSQDNITNDLNHSNSNNIQNEESNSNNRNKYDDNEEKKEDLQKDKEINNKTENNKQNFDNQKLEENNGQNNNENESNNEKEQLKQLKEKLTRYSTLKNTGLKRTKRQTNEPKLKEVEMSKENQDFMEQLENLPNFEERSKSDGYQIDTRTVTEVNETIIKALIIKFLNQRFLKKKTDLNIRSKSLEKDNGFLKWDVKNIIRHLETEELSKVLNDKYGYKYENGKNESVPLSFYFDMSGSMYNYTNMLSIIAIELLKRNVKVLVGFNEYVEYQINSIDKNLTVQELAIILKNRTTDNKIKTKIINTNIDEYLIKSKAEKCVVFSDFDSIYEVCNLSNYCQVYWFCFENNFSRHNIQNFYGFLYKVQNLEDIANGLIKVNTNHFKSLVYLNDRKR